MINRYKRIGIVGGVGPMATADFFKKILQFAQADPEFPAKTDQDFPRVIVDCNGQIPDRTKALLYGGPSPVAALVETAQNLQLAGAEVLAIPCNTAHAFLAEVQAQVDVPIVNMIEEIAAELKSTFPTCRQVGILATTGTVKSRVYDRVLLDCGLNPLHVDEDVQEKYVMEAIYGKTGVKAGHLEQPRKLLTASAQYLEKKGAQVIIMACTEIPLALETAKVPLIDGNAILAKAVLREARKKV